MSSVIAQDCGVPQGSVIGPKSFIAYTEELELDSVFLKHDIRHHGYDTQAWLSLTHQQWHCGYSTACVMSTTSMALDDSN